MQSLFVFLILPASLLAQTVESALKQAEHGRCATALPVLKRAIGQTQDKAIRRKIAVDGVRCAMSLDHAGDATDFIRVLDRDFPNDPEILFLETQAFSDLSIRASQKLLYVAPDSPEVHKLNAEAMESQGKWDEAAAEYKRILDTHPHEPDIHYRLGRIILSRPKTETMASDARKEFEAELAINPDNAGADYVLGELARQAEQWPEAIAHFQKAAEHDATFADAFLGLGQSYLAAEQPAQAVPPLITAVKLQPDNPTTHYLLSMAYSRTGHKDEAQREAKLQQEAMDRAQKAKDRVMLGVQGQTKPAPR